MSIFKSDFRFEKITDIKTEFLLEHKIKIVLLDADNTLSFHGSKEPFPGVPEWLEEIRNCGIVPVIISNNSECRIEPFAKKLGLDYVSKSKKPLSKGFRTALEKYGFEPKDSAVIGDQLFTDVLGGKILGAKVILTEPLGPENNRFIKFKRFFEKPLR